MSAPQTDHDRALAALRALRGTCTAAIDALQQPSTAEQFSILASRPTLAVIHKDFQSLLTLIYTSTTKVTLVLRPTEPAPNAALAPIRDLGTSITSLATCATLFHLYGTTLASETRLLASDVIEAVRSLTIMFVEDAGGDYLVRTGAVHDMVEKARRELPADNIAAVRKRWRADRGMLEDSLEEINAMVEDAGEGEDDMDDEWDELGFGSTKKMSGDELERTKKTQPLVRFITLFHKRVVPDVLGRLSNPPPDPDALNQALDALPSLSKSVVVALEEVVAALYAPQRPAALAASISTLVSTIHAVHTSVIVDILLPPADLERAMGALSMDSSKGGGEKAAKDPRKWFESCLAQIDKLHDQVNNGTS
ncbi:hypothetical protein BD310DRAFT_15783 [Dichomitus squalens]|uniref:Grap2 and cyclin-D-interacting-domain-containing protein n=1 Tax=Dichomitus squalens TaxID=114155 RepID=A0A4V2K9X8_9APHY|nr:hypothetical protein BD310DRAFT_15783 [Dichomitus squalens]